MSRLPIRRQVTLAFAAALAVVLVAVGVFLYLRFDAELSNTIDRGLRSRAAEVTTLVRRASPGLTETGSSSLVDADESFAQIVSPAGEVLDATPLVRDPLLEKAELDRALGAATFVERASGGPEGEPIRLLAVPVSDRGERVVVVVGVALDDKKEALSALRTLETIGLAAALILASGAGYWVSGLALRPVDAMRRRAEEISGEPGRRLPVPPVDDELGRLGETLNAMLGRIESALAAQREALAKERRFVADASHELRTPLTILKSEVEVAMLEERSRDELRAALASTGEEAERLSRLAEDLLVLARADERELPIRPEEVPLTELMQTVAVRRHARAEELSREIAIDVAPGLTVTADRPRLEQALSNLVDNALAHGAGDVEVAARRTGDQVEISVRDRGEGFPAEFRDRAFERFARPDSGRTGGGAGLGLAIVEAIAAAHGGSARVEDANPGARVVIVLPALTDP